MTLPVHNTLQRFIDAQQKDYSIALAEIKKGKKMSHWMWYIFPQLQGLGLSTTSKFYGIAGLKEAADYLRHPVLGSRLQEICQALLLQPVKDAHTVFGGPDDMKLRSSMTLFATVPESDPVFQEVLNVFFGGRKDEATLRLIQ